MLRFLGSLAVLAFAPSVASADAEEAPTPFDAKLSPCDALGAIPVAYDPQTHLRCREVDTVDVAGVGTVTLVEDRKYELHRFALVFVAADGTRSISEPVVVDGEVLSRHHTTKPRGVAPKLRRITVNGTAAVALDLRVDVVDRRVYPEEVVVEKSFATRTFVACSRGKAGLVCATSQLAG